METKVNTSQMIAPQEPAVMLYISQEGELISPHLLILAESLNLKPILSANIPITGNISIIRLSAVGFFPNTVKFKIYTEI